MFFEKLSTLKSVDMQSNQLSSMIEKVLEKSKKKKYLNKFLKVLTYYYYFSRLIFLNLLKINKNR